jgi:predicted esterase
MNRRRFLFVLLLFVVVPTQVPGAENPSNQRPVADIELTETLALPECHGIGWVSTWMRRDPKFKNQPGWDGILDEAKWGTPSPHQVVDRHWDWNFTDHQWREAVKQKGEGKREDVKFDLWIPGDIPFAKGVVVISGHGSGEGLYRRPDFRKLARELHLAVFKFIGNPMQRGFWPRSLLYERLQAFAEKSRHPELAHAPLFLYGHSNGTGFSAIFPATEGARVWGCISMRPGTTFQVYQPGAAQVPGLVIFGEDDPFLSRPSVAENLAIVGAMRKKHDAVWNYAIEPKTGHGPGDKTWPLVFSFLRNTFNARVPADADPRQGPVKLTVLRPESGSLGQNWDPAKGGYQTLPIAPFADFVGDKSVASWLVNAEYAGDWQAFQRDGQIRRPETSPNPISN